jgi:hypothetical protein
VKTVGGRSALILDDDAERRAEMHEGLLVYQVRCDEAATLAEAIQLLGASYYDLVICDMLLCDPAGVNPSFGGYLAVCFALARANARRVVQASSLRRYTHPGSILTNWRLEEVTDLLHGSRGIPMPSDTDGGCPWSALRRCETAAPERRPQAVLELVRLPIIRALDSTPELASGLDALQDAAESTGEWSEAMVGAWTAVFPGYDPGR